MRTCTIYSTSFMNGETYHQTEDVWFNTKDWNLNSVHEEEMFVVDVVEGQKLVLSHAFDIEATAEMHAAYWMERIRDEEDMNHGAGPDLSWAEQLRWYRHDSK